MRKILILLITIPVLWSCSSSVDTTLMTPGQHFKYAKKLYNNEDYQKAQNEFQSILLQFPGSAVNDDAEYYLGMTYFKSEQYLLAAYEFSKLIKDIPTSPYVPDAQFMLADSYYKLSPPYQLDQTYTKKAIQEFQAFIDFFPTNAKVQKAEKKISILTEKLAKKLYMSAYIYERMGYYRAAIIYYQDVINSFHNTKYASKALYRKINLLVETNKNKEALKEAENFLIQYPKNPNAPAIKKLEAALSNKNKS